MLANSPAPPPFSPPSPLSPCSTEEEDVEVTEDAKELLTKIGVETSLRCALLVVAASLTRAVGVAPPPPPL